MNFAVQLKGDGTLEVYKYGVAKLAGFSPVPVTYTKGDVLKVFMELDKTLDHNVVKWYRNTTVLYTSTSPSINYPLLLDTSIFSPGAWIHDAYVCSDGTGDGPDSGPGGNDGGKKPASSPRPTPARGKAVPPRLLPARTKEASHLQQRQIVLL